MLTRKQSKELFCPYTYCSQSDLYNYTCNASNCPKWKDAEVVLHGETYVCMQDSNNCSLLKEFVSISGKSGAENYKKEYADFYFANCIDCDSRFGFCGS